MILRMVDICWENGIRLVCFEDGWRVDKYYLHSCNVTTNAMRVWLEGVI